MHSYGESQYSDDNCLLSARMRSEISASADLVSDPAWSVYAVTNVGSSQCTQSQGGGSNTGDNSGQCYRQDRSGVVFYSNVVRDVRTASDLQDCSRICHQASYCRSFTYK